MEEDEKTKKGIKELDDEELNSCFKADTKKFMSDEFLKEVKKEQKRRK